MKKPIFVGSCTAMVTPYREKGIDYTCMSKLIDFQADNHSDAILISGTTGENATQSFEEHCRLLEYSATYNRNRMKMIAGIGANNTETALKYAKCAEENGYDGLLMVTPYYNKTTQNGLIQHFTYVADRVNVPVILYNVPSRTGISISAETYKILSEHQNINGVKEASGDMTLFSKTRYMCGDNLNIWSGNDDQTVPMMALGAKGVISVASNIIPKEIADMCKACIHGDFDLAHKKHLHYAELFSTLFVETNPIPVKTAMNLMGMNVGVFRLPLVMLSEPSKQKLLQSLHRLNLI